MNIQQMGKELADAFRTFVTHSLEEPLARIAALELRKEAEPVDYARVEARIKELVAALPPAAPGKDAEPVDYARVEARIKELVDAIPAAEVDYARIEARIGDLVAAIPPAPAGKDAEPVDYARVEARIKELFAAIPPASAGKDAQVDYDTIFRHIGELIAALPKPEAIDYARVQNMLKELVAALPPAASGKDAAPVDYEFISERMDTMLREAVAALPPAAPGKDADPALITQTAQNAVDVLGQSLLQRIADTTAAIGQMLKKELGELVAALPPAAPGKDAEPVDYARVEARIKELVAALPPAAPGKDAEPVHPDTLARLVAEEVRRALAEIPRAKDGEPGRDAAALEVLPSIDPQKSYPRGTFAEFAGGMIRSIRKTDPIEGRTLEHAGWAVCLNGINAEREEVLEGGRLIVRFTEYTDGRMERRELRTSIMLYRDVWKEDGDYERGDVTTLSGSSWHCNESKTKDRPGTSAAWTMMVKKGAHGKDAGGPPPSARPQVRVPV